MFDPKSHVHTFHNVMVLQPLHLDVPYPSIHAKFYGSEQVTKRPVHVGVSVYCLASKRWLHSDGKSQWIKEFPPGDKRRSLSDQCVCHLDRCRENGSKEQRRCDRKKKV
ncbi:hypothetical protein TNCV_1081381 [Trichonephila clavipes]|nr:hypothetical protein TNCV_1081381 [Trichonephila clavipes]